MSNIDELSADERSELANLEHRNSDELSEDELSEDERSRLINLQGRKIDAITARLRREGKLISEPDDPNYLNSAINDMIIREEMSKLAVMQRHYDSIHDVKNNMKDSVGGFFKGAKKWWDK
tara:strand:+ start:143 stop:505 length:363 start_codon:yes stop_codon:yes gene_type:complete